jgi:hypothetical protein
MTKLNPAVQKLAEQAKGFVDLNQHVGGDNGCMIYTYDGLNKFAQLIVRECIEQVEGNYVGAIGTYAGAHNSAISKCKKSIQEYFGVEK